MNELQTTDEVIDLLGGNAAVGLLTGTKPNAVSMWKTLGKFPWRTQLTILTELRSHGYTAPVSLWGMSAKTKDHAA